MSTSSDGFSRSRKSNPACSVGGDCSLAAVAGYRWLLMRGFLRRAEGFFLDVGDAHFERETLAGDGLHQD
jgi:hypothetical protein